MMEDAGLGSVLSSAKFIAEKATDVTISVEGVKNAARIVWPFLVGCGSTALTLNWINKA